MEERLKRRLIGGAVLVALVVIFVPMLFEEQVVSERMFSKTKFPEKPESLQRQMESYRVLPEPVPAEVEPPEPPREESEPPAPKIDQDQKISKIERPTPTAWMVQVASFSRQENADKLVGKLKNAGMPAQWKEVTIEGKRLFRVQMFPQLEKKEAEKLLKRIETQFGLKATLIRYTG